MNLSRILLTLGALGFLLVVVVAINSGLATTAKPGTIPSKSNTIWEGCQMTDGDLELAPWTIVIRHVSDSGIVAYYPAVILDHYTLITQATQATWVFIAPGPPTWTSCRDPNYSLHLQSSSAGAGAGGQGLEQLNVSHVSVYPGLTWLRPSSPDDYLAWTTNANESALIHLRSPLVFSKSLRPICLPNLTDPGSSIQNIIDRSGKVGFMEGWPSPNEPNPLLSLNIVFPLEEVCHQLWEITTDQVPYGDRACGRNSVNGTSINPKIHCIRRTSGIFVRDPESNEIVLLGFVLQFFSDRVKHRCDELSHLFISTLNVNTVDWIRRGMKCGASGRHAACNNGTCILVTQRCDGVSDCLDGEDEDPRICKPRKCCVPRLEFGCGESGCIRYVSGMADCNGIPDCPNGEDEENCPINGVIIGLGSTLAALAMLMVGSAVIVPVLRSREKFLSQEIIDEFYEGSMAGHDDPLGGEDEFLDIRRLKYDPAYEFDEDDCVLGRHLGVGRFGTVYLSTLAGKPVAIKTRNPKEVDMSPSTFIALLAELKMMLFIEAHGGHPNIVRLLGAHTRNIRTCNLQVAMEYCTNGDLATFMAKNRSGFERCVGRNLEAFASFVGETVPLIPTTTLTNFNTVDLVKWSMQIAQAMSFLQSKRILHGDLAIRNVLLDDGLNAKLCDFGLSHQLTSSSNEYITTTRLDFPWRGAAPEVLDSRGRTYNRNSDVWSFGVTMWEIFSLGQSPWSELENEGALLGQFQSGHSTLSRPQHYDCANDEIYEIMCSCWKLNPELRPSFQILTLQLQSSYDAMCTIIEMSELESQSQSQGADFEMDHDNDGQRQGGEHSTVQPEEIAELTQLENSPAELSSSAEFNYNSDWRQEQIVKDPMPRPPGPDYVSFSSLVP